MGAPNKLPYPVVGPRPVQDNFEHLARHLERGTNNGEVPTWSADLKRWVAAAPTGGGGGGGEYYEQPGTPASTTPGAIWVDTDDVATPGNVWLSGAGAPGGGTGSEGDWYLNTTTGDVYTKTGPTTWTLKMDLVPPPPVYKANPGVTVWHNADQSIAPGTLTGLNFNTVIFDQQAGFTFWGSGTPWTLYYIYPGLYYYDCSVRWGQTGANDGNHRTLEAYRNGPASFSQCIARDTQLGPFAAGGTEPTTCHVSGIVWLDATAPWLNLYVRHNATTNRSVLTAGYYSPTASLVYMGQTLLT